MSPTVDGNSHSVWSGHPYAFSCIQCAEIASLLQGLRWAHGSSNGKAEVRSLLLLELSEEKLRDLQDGCAEARTSHTAGPGSCFVCAEMELTSPNSCYSGSPPSESPANADLFPPFETATW